MLILIFTDGACAGNGTKNARAGWAYGVYDEKTLKMTYSQKGKVEGTQSNNRAELMAICKALEYISSINTTDTIAIYSDSEISIKGLKGECARNANKDIWHKIELLCETINQKRLNINVNFIESHKNSTPYHQLNNEIDKLAKIASRALL